MQLKNRRLMSILLIFAILIGIFPVGTKNVDAQSLEPKTVNGKLFRPQITWITMIIL